jgi:ribosomal protein S27AE
MRCPRCGEPDVVMENVGPNRTRAKCQKCGWASVMDEQGRQLLTGDRVPGDDEGHLLLED